MPHSHGPADGGRARRRIAAGIPTTSADVGLSPEAFAAITRTEYSVPTVSPVIVYVVVDVSLMTASDTSSTSPWTVQLAEDSFHCTL